MTLVERTEIGGPVEVELPADHGRKLAASGVVTAVPSPFRQGFWLVGPAGKVGAARVGSVEIRIPPKAEIARLLFLLGCSAARSAARRGAPRRWTSGRATTSCRLSPRRCGRNIEVMR